jgi:hypothetical protein
MAVMILFASCKKLPPEFFLLSTPLSTTVWIVLYVFQTPNHREQLQIFRQFRDLSCSHLANPWLIGLTGYKNTMIDRKQDISPGFNSKPISSCIYKLVGDYFFWNMKSKIPWSSKKIQENSESIWKHIPKNHCVKFYSAKLPNRSVLRKKAPAIKPADILKTVFQ